MKRKSSLVWRVAITLVLALSLGLVAAPMVAGPNGDQIVDITSPGDDFHFMVSETFNVVATVENTTDSVQSDVVATISWSPPGDAELVGGSLDLELGSIAPGETQDAQWTLHCLEVGDLDITVSTNYGASHTQYGQQWGNPGISIEITEPAELTKFGVGQQFEVKALITNTGQEPLTNVYTWLIIDGNALDLSGPTLVGSLDKQDTYVVTWTVECTDADEILIKPDPSDPRTWTVDYTKIYAHVDGNGEGTNGYVHDSDDVEVYQKYLIVEIFVPQIANDIVAVDDGDKVNVSREFYVYARVTNYYDRGISPGGTIWIEWDPLSGVDIFAQPPALQGLPGIPIDETGEPEFPWHFHCAEPGLVTFDVLALVIAADGITLMNWDTITIEQQDPAELEAEITTPYNGEAFGISNTFEVTATISNDGGETATDVTATLVINGSASEVGDEDLTQNLPDIPGGGSETVTWTVHCDGPGNPTFTVTPAGKGANTGEQIDDDNDEYSDPIADSVNVRQLPLKVEITNTTSDHMINVSQTFSVEAELTNLGGTTLGPIDLTLEIAGLASPVTGESLTKTIGEVLPGDTQYVAWTLHCDGPGDVELLVKAETNWYSQDLYTYSDDNPQTPESDPVIIHQQRRDGGDISVEIISPDLGAKYATSQDFAVTVEITNHEDDGSTVTIDWADVIIDPLLSPNRLEVIDFPGPVDIPSGESRTITFTVHVLESGFSFFIVAVSGQDDLGRLVDAHSWPIWVWLYPAAHLEVEIIEVLPDTTINVSDPFTVRYKVTNTGEADATEVVATLSVTPEGSARPVAGDNGYTQYIGTIPGHGQVNDTIYEWDLRCKVPSESTITITAAGYDEYGWHMKQESSSTGSFVIWGGWKSSESLWTFPDSDVPAKGWSYGVFVGDANGLNGPFNFETDVSFAGMGGGPDITGHEVGMGAVIPNVRFDGPGWDEGDDLLIWISHYIGDTDMDFIADADWEVYGGLIQVINGNLTGAWIMSSQDVSPNEWAISLLGGTYHTNLAAEAGRAIDERNIEPDSVTVKQLPMMADLEVEKNASGSTFTVGEMVTFTITLTNNGPSDAKNIHVTDLLPAGLNYAGSDPVEQGWYDVMSGIWDVGNLAEGADAHLVIMATVNTVGDIINRATITAAGQGDPVTANNSDMVTITGQAPPPQDDWTIQLDDGYNLISLPLIPSAASPNIATMTSGVDFDKISTYVADGAAWFNYDGPAGAPDDLDNLDDGQGYWFNMANADTMYFAGWELVAETDPPSLPPSYPVVSGWNLIGFKSTMPMLPEDYLAGIAGKYVIIYGYENGMFFIAGAPGHSMLQPERGYWIAIMDGESGTIYP